MSGELTIEGVHEVPPGSLVVIRTSDHTVPELAESAARMIAAEIGHGDFALLVIAPDIDIEVLDEERMGLLGWVRVPF